MKNIKLLDCTHLLEDEENWAIQAALAANRPLLVRGEPGVGKTQLAHAAAVHLGRPLVSFTVDANTESRELLWTFDAVQRLAEAQVASNIYKDLEQLEEKIDVRRFIRPGPIWWALNWKSAEEQLSSAETPPAKPQKSWTPQDGVVVLIDEIDKAESDLPNGLLEALGARQFTPQGWNGPVSIREGDKPPLVVITTNEERMLPNAFIRRCFVLNIEIPGGMNRTGEAEFVEHLVKRGKAHFPKKDFPEASEDLLDRAAKLLFEDRMQAIEKQQFPRPGQAEYLDFLRAILNLAQQGIDPNEVFEKISAFVFKKSSGIDQ